MSTRAPRRPRKGTAPPPPPEPTRPTAAQLASLDPVAFRRAMLEQILLDLDRAREKGSMSAVMTLTSQAMRLRVEIGQVEEEERARSLAARSTDALVDDLVRLVAELPEHVYERVADAVELRRTGRPRMRVVRSSPRE